MATKNRGLSALLDKKNPRQGKSRAKGKKEPVKPKKAHFEVLIRIPWEQHKIVMDYGETKKGYREVPTFNGSLKKVIPEFSRLQKYNKDLQEDLDSFKRKYQVQAGILSRFRTALIELTSPVPELNKENNYELPFKSGTIGMKKRTKTCPACGHAGLDILAERCSICEEYLYDDDID